VAFPWVDYPPCFLWMVLCNLLLNHLLRRQIMKLGTVAQCTGCDNITPLAGMCTKYASVRAPEGVWRRGVCPYATHVVKVKEVTGKVRAGQQKQKKVKK
jgi:hypothetical protein